MTITDGLLRDLAGFSSDRAPVTSCYLDVDGRRYIRPQDIEPHLDDLLRRGRRRVTAGNGHTHDRTAVASVEADLRRISDHVRGGIDRSSTRGLAMFSCSAGNFWQVVELAVPVPNVIVVNATPHIRVLEAVRDHHLRFAVLLVDRQRARILLFEQGQLIDRQEHFDRLPRHDDDGGHMPRDDRAGHAQAAAAHHLRRAAQAAFAAFQEQAFDHLVLGTPEALGREMERELHPWLRDRIAARLTIPVAARDDEIAQAALEVEERVERAREAAMVERLRQAVGAGTGAAVGLQDVLAALVARRVDTLVVSEGFEAPGWRCRGCGYVGLRGRRCPVCAAGMDQVDDVVEEAVEDALNQSCRLALCRGNPDLDVLGRIGAILRF